MNQLIAIVGLTGSGKSEVTKAFVERDYQLVYFGGVTMAELKKRGLEANEINERAVREQLRAELGMSAYAQLNAPNIKELLDKGSVVIDGLYSWEEYTFLKELFANLKVVAVYAPPQIRYQRLAKRAVRPLTTEEAASRDYSEIEKLHKAGPIAMADQTFINIGSSDELAKAVSNYINGHA